MKIVGWILAAVLLAAGAALLMAPHVVTNTAYKPDMLKTGVDVATALFVIMLFVERLLAVVNALIFGEEQRKAELTILQASSAKERAPGEERLTKVLESKERLRLLLGFGFGLFVSIGGVRTLQALMTVTGNPDPLFIRVDVILTAGLIAGGSNGLAYIIQVLKDLMTPPGKGTAHLRARLITTT